uniref:helix-turn-helix domain-containing protein n=1 Tax=Candidatus Scatousia sp. TaxID=3085663 RepID=UPI0040275C2B
MLEKDFLKRVGSVIRSLRIASGNRSLNEFAVKNNIPSSTLSRIEIGENEAQLHTLQKIADGLGLTLSELFSLIECDISQ